MVSYVPKIQLHSYVMKAAIMKTYHHITYFLFMKGKIQGKTIKWLKVRFDKVLLYYNF